MTEIAKCILEAKEKYTERLEALEGLNDVALVAESALSDIATNSYCRKVYIWEFEKAVMFYLHDESKETIEELIKFFGVCEYYIINIRQNENSGTFGWELRHKEDGTGIFFENDISEEGNGTCRLVKVGETERTVIDPVYRVECD